MTSRRERPVPSAALAEDGVRADDKELAPAEFLEPVLVALIENVRTTARRVIDSGEQGANAAADNDDAVHDFRVALRRLRTLLRPAKGVFGKKKLRHALKGLRDFARATGALREQEALRETLRALDLDRPTRAGVDAWLAQGAQQEQTARRHVIELLRADLQGSGTAAPLSTDDPARSPRLEPHLAELGRRIARRKVKKCSAVELGRRTLAEALRDVRALATGDLGDSAAMHALRIRFKRLRYSAETFTILLGEGARRVAKSASRMQRLLGQLHDIDEALAWITREAGPRAPSSNTPPPVDAVLAALSESRRRLVERLGVELPSELHSIEAHWPSG